MSGAPESKRRGAGVAGQPADGVARSPLPAGLYLVATPIGHARDITLRALDVLRDADGLAAEDTRRTRQLLDIHGIQVGDRPLVSYHDRNGPARRPQILGWLAEGKSIAYASDAGTPLVADPGYRLAEAAREAGHQVTVVPGASAVLAALSVAGLPTDRFYFGGFLPTKTAARRAALTELAGVPGTLVFFESPRRAADALADMSYVLGPERDGALARELTKAFEEVRRGSLADLAEEAAEDPPRGEVVLLAGPRGVEATRADASARLDAVLGAALETLSVKEAARSVATELGLPKREVYARALEMAKVAD